MSVKNKPTIKDYLVAFVWACLSVLALYFVLLIFEEYAVDVLTSTGLEVNECWGRVCDKQ